VSSTTELRNQLATAFSTRSESHRKGVKFIELAFVVLGALLAGVAPLFENGVGWPPTPWQVASVCGFAMTALGGMYLIMFRDDSDYLREAATALKQAEDHRDELFDTLQAHEDMALASKQLRSLYLCHSISRAMLERAIVGRMSEEVSLIEEILLAIRTDLRIALGFEMAQTWTIVVYRRELNTDDGYHYLKCVAHDRSIQCDIAKARQWREGIGVGGMALSRRDEIVAPDILQPSAVSLFSLNGESFREEDHLRYRSMFAVPIQVGNDAIPWGVVLVSCNQADHFRSIEDDLVRESMVSYKEATRALAGIAALAVAMCRARASAE
jgi:hypothetical protein